MTCTLSQRLQNWVWSSSPGHWGLKPAWLGTAPHISTQRNRFSRPEKGAVLWGARCEEGAHCDVRVQRRSLSQFQLGEHIAPASPTAQLSSPPRIQTQTWFRRLPGAAKRGRHRAGLSLCQTCSMNTAQVSKASFAPDSSQQWDRDAQEQWIPHCKNKRFAACAECQRARLCCRICLWIVNYLIFNDVKLQLSFGCQISHCVHIYLEFLIVLQSIS